MVLLKKTITSSSSIPSGPIEKDLTPEFADDLFAFITQMLATQSGGGMFIAAGIMPILVSSLAIQVPLKVMN